MSYFAVRDNREGMTYEFKTRRSRVHHELRIEGCIQVYIKTEQVDSSVERVVSRILRIIEIGKKDD